MEANAFCRPDEALFQSVMRSPLLQIASRLQDVKQFQWNDSSSVKRNSEPVLKQKLPQNLIDSKDTTVINFSVLEQTKTLADDAFNILIQDDSFSFSKQLELLTMQIQTIHEHLKLPDLNVRVEELLEQYKLVLKEKTSNLNLLVVVDRKYMKTLPMSARKQQ